LSMVRIFPRAVDQTKKATPNGDLYPPNTLLRETKIIISTHDTGKGFKTEQPSFGLDAPQLALVFPSHSH
jgi:hypothetical protein